MPARSHRVRKFRWSPPRFDGTTCLCHEKRSVGRPSLRSSAVVLNQSPPQLRSHGNQSRLAELRFPNRQDRLAQVHVSANQVCRLPQPQAGPIVQQDHRADRRWLQDDALRMGLDHLEKAAEFFTRVDVGNECRRLLRHYGRKRDSGDMAAAHGHIGRSTANNSTCRTTSWLLAWLCPGTLPHAEREHWQRWLVGRGHGRKHGESMHRRGTVIQATVERKCTVRSGVGGS